MPDLIKERFTQGNLSDLISHRDILEADYFLFMKTVTNVKNPSYFKEIWCPRSCVYLNHPPSYVSKSESKQLLEKMIKVIGFEDSKKIYRKIKISI